MVRIVIIGGGFGGLDTATWLVDMQTTMQVLLLEQKPTCGGRAHTTRDPVTGHIQYERGPWRVLDSQERMRALVRRFGCHLRPLSHNQPGAFCRFPAVSVRTSAEAPLEGLSNWDRDAMSAGVSVADANDRASGYAGVRRNLAVGSDTYNISDLDAHPAGSVVVEGFDVLAERMQTWLLQKGVTVLTDTHVVHLSCKLQDPDKDKRYRITYRQRNPRGHFEEERTIVADVVICATPPSTWTSFMDQASVMTHLRPLTTLVMAHPLARVYAKVGKLLAQRFGTTRYHMISGRAATAQLISPNYGTQWAAVAYVGSEHAWLLRRLEMNNCRGLLASYLAREMGTLMRDCEAPNVLIADSANSADSVTQQNLKWWPALCHKLQKTADVCFYAEAIHSWVPHVMGPQSLEERQGVARRCVLEPHLTALPYLYVVGEAFSTKQGWIEGALETSRWLLESWPHQMRSLSSSEPSRPLSSHTSLIMPMPPNPPKPQQWIVYDGRLIDVTHWISKHPGGMHAILNHLGEDVTLLLAHVPHPSYALAILWYLQVGWL